MTNLAALHSAAGATRVSETARLCIPMIHRWSCLALWLADIRLK